ncbi:MAG: hypothetical protein ACLFNI_11420 [Natronomonas sp.]
MTAQRWWVRLFARWQARLDSVQGQIQMLSLAVTAYSTFSLVLQGFGLGRWVPVVGAAALLVGPGYAYLFFEGGVWNQVARDRADKSSNFAAPSQRIEKELTVRGLAAMMKGRELTAEERAIAKGELDAVFEEYRDGYELER